MKKELRKHLILICISAAVPMLIGLTHHPAAALHHAYLRNIFTFAVITLFFCELICKLYDNYKSRKTAYFLNRVFPYRDISWRKDSSTEKTLFNRIFSIARKRLPFIFCVFFLVSLFCIQASDKFDETTEKLKHTEAISIQSGDVLEQDIVVTEKKKLSAINIKFGTYNRINDGLIKVELLEDGENIRDWTILSSTLTDNAYKVFDLDPLISIKQGLKYSLRITEVYDNLNNVAVWTNKKEGPGYWVNKAHHENGSICYTLTYRNTALQGRSIRIGVPLALFTAILILAGISEVPLMAFLLMALMLIYNIVCPPFMAPDEENHFKRAFEVAEVGYISAHIGEKGTGGNILPSAINKYIGFYLKENTESTEDLESMEKDLDFSDHDISDQEEVPNYFIEDSTDENLAKKQDVLLSWNEVEEMEYGNTALYSPISYMPQAVGIRIACVISDNIGTIFYAGRLGNTIVNLLLCIMALLIIPFGRRILFLIMTFPLSLQEMISMSPDGFTISISLLFFANILRLSYQVKKVRHSDLFLTTISAFILAQLKIVYVVLLLLVFMIPQNRFRSRHEALFVKIGVVCAAGFTNLLWLMVSSGFLVEFNPGVDSPAQVSFILQHFGNFSDIAFYTFLNSGSRWISTMIGSIMGAYSISTTGIVWIAGYTFFLYEISTCIENTSKIHKWDPFILILTFLSGVVLIVTSLYIQWNPLQNPFIEGVQGRYFTPLLILLAFFVVFVRQIRLNKNGITTGIYVRRTSWFIVILLYNGIALLDIINYYIHDFF